MQAEINAIAEKARKSIGEFCSSECRAYCCRKGYLVMNTVQAGLLTSGRISDFISEKRMKRISDDKYSLFLGDYEKPCPCLKDFRCMVHSNPLRPEACRDFPVFVDAESMTVRLSHRCLAVKEGRMYAFEKQWLALGCRVVYSDPFYDIELSRADLPETRPETRGKASVSSGLPSKKGEAQAP
ncbi:MAG: hypothetical protein R6U32_01980 [Candidatus Woesearchaeota archaeon]